MARVCCLVVLCTLVLCQGRAAPTKKADIVEEGDNFLIMIDAGSSGSRVHVLVWKEPQPEDANIPMLRPVINKKIQPGLSSFAETPSKAVAAVKDLLEFAKQNIPVNSWRDTPIFLRATAGLRQLSAAQSTAILEQCRRALSGSTFRFQPDWASVLKGAQEGVFSWIAANYLARNFHEFSRSHLDSSKATVGIIECGGASLQITFVPEPTDRIAPSAEHFTDVTVGDSTFTVYTHSYLNYGLEAAMDTYLEKNHDILTKQGNPCSLQEERDENKDGIRGIGSHELCDEFLENMFDINNCSYVTCGFNNVFQPQVKGEHFYAIENFFYTPSFFGLTNGPKAFRSLISKGREYCQLTLKEAAKKYPGETPKNYFKYCFSSVYLVKLLTYGMGIKSPRQSVKIVRDIAGVPLDWALGAAVHEITKLLFERKKGRAVLQRVRDSREGPAGRVDFLSATLGFALVISLIWIVVFTKRRVKTTPSIEGLMNSFKRRPVKPATEVQFHRISSLPDMHAIQQQTPAPPARSSPSLASLSARRPNNV